MNDFVGSYRLGDWASILGLTVGIVGFVVTIWNVIKSKRAALSAERAAQLAQNAVNRSHAIQDLSAAVAMLGEIERLQRERFWSLVPGRYAALKLLLISVRGSTPSLTPRQRSVLQNTIVEATELKQKIERSRTSDVEQLDPAALNETVTRHADKLYELLVSIREKIGA